MPLLRIMRRADDFTQDAVVNIDDAVKAVRQRRVMAGNDQGGAALPATLLQQVHDHGAGKFVQRSGRFVGQDDGGTRSQGAGDRDAQPLTRAQLDGAVTIEFAQPDAGQQFAGAGAAFT